MRRATLILFVFLAVTLFLSTPSVRRATVVIRTIAAVSMISIHALREEGDRFLPVCLLRRFDFYPRPP